MSRQILEVISPFIFSRGSEHSKSLERAKEEGRNLTATSPCLTTASLILASAGTTTSKHMSSPITSGQCNSCHGVSTSKLWMK